MQVAEPLEYLIEYYLSLKVIDSCLFIKIDPSVKIFLVVSHDDVQALLSILIGHVTAKNLYYKIIFKHLYYLYLAVFVSRVLDDSFYSNDLSCFSVPPTKDLTESTLTYKLNHLDIIITELR